MDVGHKQRPAELHEPQEVPPGCAGRPRLNLSTLKVGMQILVCLGADLPAQNQHLSEHPAIDCVRFYHQLQRTSIAGFARTVYYTGKVGNMEQDTQSLCCAASVFRSVHLQV